MISMIDRETMKINYQRRYRRQMLRIRFGAAEEEERLFETLNMHDFKDLARLALTYGEVLYWINNTQLKQVSEKKQV